MKNQGKRPNRSASKPVKTVKKPKSHGARKITRDGKK